MNTSMFLARSRTILSFFGIWLWSQKNFLCQAYMIFTLVVQYSFVVFEIVYIAQVWGDMEAVAEASYLLFTQASVCYKTTAFLFNEKWLTMLLDCMDSEVFALESQNHERISTKLAHKIKRLFMFLLASANTTVTLWAVIPFLDKSGSRSFPFKIWMPISPETSPGYELGYFYQMSAIYISAFLFIGVDSVTLSMIMFGCAQLEIIMDKLEQVRSVPAPSAENRNARDELLKSNRVLFTDCVRRHQAVVGFIGTVENTYHASIFFQLVGTVPIICNIALRIRTTLEDDFLQLYSMLTYMVTMLTQLLLYCWTGHELTTRSEVLRDCLYQCPWYEQDITYRRAMWITLERMKKPIIFRVGHYVPLSRPTFVAVLRCSYSYFAVLSK